MTTQSVKSRQDRVGTAQEPSAIQAVGPIVLKLHPAMRISDAQFFELCALNDDLRLERNARGDMELMPPAFPETGNQNFRITARLAIWAENDGRGEGFDSSSGFTLPNGAVRSPDASWILKSRLSEMTESDREGFWKICPDFVIELRSSSDRLADLQTKMVEYMENGARLGWLIDPVDPQHMVYVYRPGAEVEVLEGPESLSGDPELPGFVLDLQPIWEPGV